VRLGVDSARCDRRGWYRVAGLIARFGPDASMPTVLVPLSVGRPQRQEFVSPYKRCRPCENST
jgi:hypothetical protein